MPPFRAQLYILKKNNSNLHRYFVYVKKIIKLRIIKIKQKII